MKKLIIATFVLGLSSTAFAESNDMSDYYQFGFTNYADQTQVFNRSSTPHQVGDSQQLAEIDWFINADNRTDETIAENNVSSTPHQVGDSQQLDAIEWFVNPDK